MTNYTLGSTYQIGYINTADEVVPQNHAFATRPGDEYFFEPHTFKCSFNQVAEALEQGIITELDKTVLSLVAVFGSAACTSRNLLELLTLMGINVNYNRLDSSLKRLCRYLLINFSRFKLLDSKQSNLRIITLTNHGSRLAKALGVIHRFNPLAIATAEPYAVKSRLETVQLICNWLKNLPVENFSVRPVKVIDAAEGAIIRPAAEIAIFGDSVCVEVPRRHDGWVEDLVGKLNRYRLVFGDDNLPTIIINGEDSDMNLELHQAIQKANFKAEILYTEDLLMFGPSFASCLYTFDSLNEKIFYTFKIKESENIKNE